MASTWFTRLRSQFFGINLLVAILATLAGILVVTREAQGLARELLTSHMAEVGYSLSTSLSDAPDQAGMQQRLQAFLGARRLSASMVVVTGSDGRIVAATDSSYVGQPWGQIFPGSQPPVPDHACQSSSWQGCQEGQFELPLASGQALDAARSLAPLAGSNLSPLVLHYIAPQNAYDLAVSRSVLIGLGVMIALVLLLSLLELALFNGQVFRPLEELARADQALAEGRTSEGHLLPAPGTAREIAGLIESRERLIEGMERLLECSGAMLATRTVEEVALTLIGHLAKAVGSKRGIVWLSDPGSGTYVPTASYGAQPDTLPEFPTPAVGPQAEANPTLVRDHPILRALGLPRAFLVPIHIDQQPVGMAVVEAPGREVTSVELQQAHSFAHYAALALERLQLYRHIQEEGSQMGLLAKLAARLATERDAQALLDRACRETRQFILCRAVAIFTVEPGGMRLGAQDGFDERAAHAGLMVEMPRSVALQLSSGPMLIEDIDRQRPDLRVLPLPSEVHSLLTFPLNLSDQVHGLLLFAFDASRPASSVERAVGETLATLLAALRENATAFAALQHQRSLLMTVSEVGTEISSILDPAVLYNRVCDLLAARLQYEHVHILIVEEGGMTARFVGGSGPKGRRQVDQQDRVSVVTRSINGHVMQTRLPYLSQDVRTDPYYLDVDSLPGILAELTLPILSAGTLLGMLDVQATRAHTFTDDDQFALQIVVEQLANAILNARQHEALREQARRDSLTQVLSHGTFVIDLEAAVSQAHAAHSALSLIMLDIDHFKEYNDEYGHVAGDAALLSTVDAIRRHIKHGDLLGRWGGEEFSIALLGATRDQASAVAERIQLTLEELRPVDSLGRQMKAPTVSQGIAGLGVDASDAFSLVDVADRALYRAKVRGRNQVRLADAEDRRPSPSPLRTTP